jgi:hypothetical protein
MAFSQAMSTCRPAREGGQGVIELRRLQPCGVWQRRIRCQALMSVIGGVTATRSVGVAQGDVVAGAGVAG